MSDIQDYFVSDIECIIKKHKTLTTIPPIHVCIDRINNRLVFKMKNGYKLELQTPETMKLLQAFAKINREKYEAKVSSLERVEVVLAQCNLVDNQYQQKFEVLYPFTPNNSYAYLLNAEPRNLVFLKTYNTVLDEIIITFMDQNSRTLEVQDKVNLQLLIN